MKDTGHVTKKLIFSTFRGYCCLSINIRIEVHIFLFALGNERTPVTCKSCEEQSTSQRGVFHFPMQTKKVYFNPQVHNFFLIFLHISFDIVERTCMTT